MLMFSDPQNILKVRVIVYIAPCISMSFLGYDRSTCEFVDPFQRNKVQYKKLIKFV